MNPPMVFGGKSLIETVTKKSITWPIKLVFMIEHAYAQDSAKHYWLVQCNDKSYMTVISDRFFNCVGWGTVRKGDDVKMQVCQAMPKEIEKALRIQTIEKIKLLQEERRKVNADVNGKDMPG